jgi:hypothetical protein
MKYAEIQHTDYKVSDFISWQRAKTLELSPSFQRRPVWSSGAKSFLIDTVVRGLPMPVIFLRSVPSSLSRYEPNRQVVDGQQRIRTLMSFIAPELLDDIHPPRDTFLVQRNHNRELAGKRFDQLSADFKQRLLDYEFSVHVFPSSTDDREILQIFARMNATGVKLNQQELRNAEFFGLFKTLMYELGAEQLNRWRQWGVFSEYNIARMAEVELTSEFALLMLSGVAKKEQPAINATYKRFEESFPQSKEVARRFHSVMDFLDDNFDVHVTPFASKVLFYSLFAAVYHLQFGIKSPLEPASPAKIPADNIAWLTTAAERIEKGDAPAPVIDATKRQTTNAGSRLALIRYLAKSSTL